MSGRKDKNRFKNKCASLINYTCIVVIIECLILLFLFFQKNRSIETVSNIKEKVILNQKLPHQESDIYEILTRNMKADYFKIDILIYGIKNLF